MTDHSNDERTVRCPVEGCDATPLARGINLHINRSSGGGHGPRGEVPDNISLDDLETVGERKVEMDYPEERDNEKHARLCPYCSETFTGISGLMIHLGQKEGRDNHPANPKDQHDPSDFPRVEVDDHGNITSVINGTGNSNVLKDGKTVPVRAVYTLVAQFIAEGDMLTAHRVRKHLLGADNPTRPVRTASPYPELFSALLAQGYDEETDQQISATIKFDGIEIACRGESALYSADEALDLAASLENIASRENWEGEMPDFIAFLRRGADSLDSEDTERGPNEEFER